MMKRIFLILFILFNCGFSKNLRIVSLCPYITENLVLLGEEKNIVGLTLQDREKYKKNKEIVGSMLEPNIEKIVSLNPDIVIASEEGNRPESIRKLNQLRIKTFVLPQLFSIEDIFKNFMKLAEITGKREKGEEIIRNAKKNLENLKFRKKKKVFFILGWKPLITSGKRTFINDVIEVSGGQNIFSDINKKWIRVGIEEVVLRNPDVIIYIEMGEKFADYLKRLKDVEAVKKNKIFKLQPYEIGSPTPESIVEVCYKINRFLNED